MCGIENMYLCNCIVRLMANSFLEEKNILYMFVYGFPFLRGECKFCALAVFLLGKEPLLKCRKRNVAQQLMDPHVNDLTI